MIEKPWANGSAKKVGCGLQFLAQFSQAPPSRRVSFWQDAVDTERWLESLSKEVSHRQLVLSARTWRHLAPWREWQRSALMLQGWLHPMEIQLTWKYLLNFLAEQGPDAVFIPCGGDAWVSWAPGEIVVRAPRESWIWAMVENAWDPASWQALDEIEWWMGGRPQHARRFSWGIAEYGTVAPGWEEWRLTGESLALSEKWRELAERLGARPVKVRWRQEHFGGQEKLLGLPIRVGHMELLARPMGPEHIRQLASGPEPVGVKARLEWSVPQWNPFWQAQITLRRWHQSARLDARFGPTSGDTGAALREMRREIRKLPILSVSPLPADLPGGSAWSRLCYVARQHHRLESLTRTLSQRVWPAMRPGCGRIRLPQGDWRILPVESRSGLWVIGRSDGLRIGCVLPHHEHPGNLFVRLPATQGVTLWELDPRHTVDRYQKDWRYWAALVVNHLVPEVDAWKARFGE